MYFSNQGVTQAAKYLKKGILYLLKVDNFSLFLKEINFDRYNKIINNLKDQIIQSTQCYALEINHDKFWIISESNIKQDLNKIIKKYNLEKKIYFSIKIESMKFTQNDNIEKLQYQILAQIEPTKQIPERKKIYDLYESINNKKLSIALQPIVDNNQNTYCHECLLRTNNRFFSSTSEVINIAEHHELILSLDEYILELVIEKIKKNKDLILSINISCNSINNTNWLQNFINNIEKHKISENLIVEVTETTIKRNYTRFTRFINEMHKIGVKVSLDDFGSGYTSFVQLTSLNIDFVKIDGSFIKNLIYNKASELFIKSVTEIAHSLGIKTIAECVENQEIANILKSWGTDYLQGFYFGKPCLTLT
ncbi:MAG: EAL domain-containing protein [Rickettsiaceae bacterium H1]|nr:EAL domain-containing protein [Rickettsiaceae bacterium H1]